MPEYDYHLLDVFTTQRFGGNPLAVFPQAAGMDEGLMQQIAKELNLSETTFVLPPSDGQSDYHVRIFTPARELPMAGHPTVGTAFLLHRLGKLDAPGTVTFQEGVGPVPVALSLDDAQRLVATMSQPMPDFGKIYENRAEIAAMLSITENDLLADYPLQVVSTGVPFLLIPIKDLATIQHVNLRIDLWDRLLKVDGHDVFVFTPETVHDASALHSRMFAPTMHIAEDPATGAAAGPVAAYMVKHGLLQPGAFVNEQGYEMGRPSLIQIGIDYEWEQFTGVRVGGNSAYVGRGTIVID
ncbi:MAG: PhzF family phenazine biosynthesis protein [Chloroflexota bacterium]